MPSERSVYLLDPKKLSPEVIAVTFAKTSRSPESFRQIAAELTDEKSAEFHEKWVVGYGHASVAEHAVLHIAAENISRLAVETLESNRLASYTEKSTRYQKWDADHFYIPRELEGSLLNGLYLETCQMLFAAYEQALPRVAEVIRAENPRKADEKDAAWDRRIRSKYVDVCRFLLPAAALANVGMTINARALEHAIRKMLSHPLDEVRALGMEIKTVAEANVPTLIKYADCVPYLEHAQAELEKMANGLNRQGQVTSDWCQLIACNDPREEAILASALYRYGGLNYTQSLAIVRNLTSEERKRVYDVILGQAGKFDIPIRETEALNYQFDLILDQGGFFELKRHRMMTQSAQALTTDLGYTIPLRISLAGFEPEYRQAMDMAADAYRQLAAWNPHVASYVVPNGYNRRVMLSFNYRTARHFIGLRAAANAHFSLRRVAQRMAEEIREVTPLAGSYLPNPTGETWQQIEREHFTQA